MQVKRYLDVLGENKEQDGISTLDFMEHYIGQQIRKYFGMTRRNDTPHAMHLNYNYRIMIDWLKDKKVKRGILIKGTRRYTMTG